jgi:hypothetical protein
MPMGFDRNLRAFPRGRGDGRFGRPGSGQPTNTRRMIGSFRRLVDGGVSGRAFTGRLSAFHAWAARIGFQDGGAGTAED